MSGVLGRVSHRSSNAPVVFASVIIKRCVRYGHFCYYGGYELRAGPSCDRG